MPFSSLRDHFYVLRPEDVANVLPNIVDVSELLVFEKVHVYAYFELHLLFNHALIVAYKLFDQAARVSIGERSL